MQGTRRRPAEGPGGPGVAADPGRVEKAREGAEVQAPGARPRPLGPGPAPLDPARHGRPLPPGGAGLLQPMSAGGPARPMNAPALGRPASRGEPASESAGGAGGGRRGTPAERPRLPFPGRARKFLFPEPGSAGTLRGTALVSAFCKASSPAGEGRLRGAPPPAALPGDPAAGSRRLGRFPSLRGPRPPPRPALLAPGCARCGCPAPRLRSPSPVGCAPFRGC